MHSRKFKTGYAWIGGQDMELSFNRTSCWWLALLRLKGRHGLPSYIPHAISDAGDAKWTQSASCVDLANQPHFHILNGCLEAPNHGRLSWRRAWLCTELPQIFYEQTSFNYYNCLCRSPLPLCQWKSSSNHSNWLVCPYSMAWYRKQKNFCGDNISRVKFFVRINFRGWE